MCSSCYADWRRCLYTSWPIPPFGSPEFSSVELYPSARDWQCIGYKGLLKVLKERGFSVYKVGHSGRTKPQEELVKMLQTCPDFNPKTLHERARVTELMKERGHIAMFGVKYHAELAHIERKWMWLKQKIRPRLNGTIRRLQQELEKWFPQFALADAQKAARHCRETMRGYQVLHAASADVTLLALDEEVRKQYTSHRRVFDVSTGQLRALGGQVLSEREEFFARRAEQRTELGEFREKKRKGQTAALEEGIRRRRRAKRTDAQKEKGNAATQARVQAKRPLKRPRETGSADAE